MGPYSRQYLTHSPIVHTHTHTYHPTPHTYTLDIMREALSILFWMFYGCCLWVRIDARQQRGQEQRQQQEATNIEEPPINKWEIGQPTFETDRLDLLLNFPISDFIPYDHIQYTFWTTCGTDGVEITENKGYFQFEIDIDDESVPVGDGTSWRFMSVSMFFDPDKIRSSPIFSKTSNLEEVIQFCVKAGAFSAPMVVPGSLEIFQKVTTINLLIAQDGSFSNKVNVTAGQQGSEETSNAYFLRGYLCDLADEEIIDPLPIFQGAPVKVCVTPQKEALADGVYMRAVDSFSWTRETIYQAAIVPNQEPAPLTEINCEPGMIICSFITLLKADFFYKLGDVYGAGIGWLQVRRERRIPCRSAVELNSSFLTSKCRNSLAEVTTRATSEYSRQASNWIQLPGGSYTISRTPTVLVSCKRYHFHDQRMRIIPIMLARAPSTWIFQSLVSTEHTGGYVTRITSASTPKSIQWSREMSLEYV